MFTIAAILMVISVVTLVWIHLREEKRRAKRYAELFVHKKEQEAAEQKQKELEESGTGEESLENMSLDELAAGIKEELAEDLNNVEELSDVEIAMQEIHNARHSEEPTSPSTTELDLDK